LDGAIFDADVGQFSMPIEFSIGTDVHTDFMQSGFVREYRIFEKRIRPTWTSTKNLLSN